MSNPMDTTKTTVEIKISAQVSLQTLADIIITAIEGGINYWSQTVTYRWTEGPIHTYADIIEVGDGDEDEEDRKHHKIDLEVIKRGIERVLSAHAASSDIMESIHLAVAEDDAGHIDGDAADVIVQFGLLGEIIYG